MVGMRYVWKNKYEMFSLTHEAVINPPYGHRFKKTCQHKSIYIVFFYTINIHN